MARWQTLFMGKPTTDPIVVDGQDAEPMDAEFDRTPGASAVAANLGVTLGAFASILLALAFFNYDVNYVDAV